MLVQSLVASAIAIASVNAKSAWKWHIPVESSQGLDEVQVGFNFKHVESKKFWDAKQQIAFVSNNEIDALASLGFQPEESNRVKAYFHTNIDGLKPIDSYCKEGYLGGPGIVCEIEVPSTFDSDHIINLSRIPDTHQWTLYLLVGGSRYPMGHFTMPYNYQGVKGDQYGFLEAYVREFTCSIKSDIAVEVIPPSDGNGKVGQLGDFKAQIPCDEDEHSKYAQLPSGNVLITSS